MKKLALALLAALVLLLAAVLIRTARFGEAQGEVPAAAAYTAPAGAAERLAEAIRIPTISHEDSARFDAAAFAALHELLRARFPRVHARLRRETVGGYSLLYTWPGTDPSLPPVLLMGHMDVVPVEAETEARWTRPPFAGTVEGGFVWGRGSLDDKASVLGTLERWRRWRCCWPRASRRGGRCCWPTGTTRRPAAAARNRRRRCCAGAACGHGWWWTRAA